MGCVGCVVSLDHDAFPAASSFMNPNVLWPWTAFNQKQAGADNDTGKICCASIGPANGTGVRASKQSEASRSRFKGERVLGRRRRCGPRYLSAVDGSGGVLMTWVLDALTVRAAQPGFDAKSRERLRSDVSV